MKEKNPPSLTSLFIQKLATPGFLLTSDILRKHFAFKSELFLLGPWNSVALILDLKTLGKGLEMEISIPRPKRPCRVGVILYSFRIQPPSIRISGLHVCMCSTVSKSCKQYLPGFQHPSTANSLQHKSFPSQFTFHTCFPKSSKSEEQILLLAMLWWKPLTHRNNQSAGFGLTSWLDADITFHRSFLGVSYCHGNSNQKPFHE